MPVRIMSDAEKRYGFGFKKDNILKQQPKPQQSLRQIQTSLNLFQSNGGIEQRVKQMGIKTPQVLVCAKAADTFNGPFTLQELADKANELGLVTKQGAFFIVKYYLQILLNAGLSAITTLED